jgi:hypothetical protein
MGAGFTYECGQAAQPNGRQAQQNCIVDLPVWSIIVIRLLFC